MAEAIIPLGEKLSRRAQATPDAPAVSCGEITLTWGQLEARANRIARALEELGVKLGDLVTIGLPNGVDFIEACWAWRFCPGDTALIPGPLYHNGPFGCAMDALTSDLHVVLMLRFDAERVLAEIERRRASWSYLVPTMMSRIWRLPEEERARYDVSSMKTLWHFGAPCPPWLKEAFINWLGPEVIMELYGGSEEQASTTITGGEWLGHRGSVGRVYRGEMKAFDASGNVLPPGEVGEIYMRRPDGSPPSYSYRGATARVLPGGWESLGDIGYFDADGYLYLAHRRTDMILVGESNVYPAEVEAAIDEHSQVMSSAVIGLAHEDMGSSIHAIVQAHPSLTADALLVHLAERLVTYKLPRTIEFVAEPLRDEAGKVRRSQLREERIAHAATVVDQT
ncbi:AMP-binding protein [Bradyrhizobium sp. CB2312]|uniref:AMP-binding protein n=1 Tax=Bradyrhizobium sp. CB2312 TaxID=3039155 RepID=UPI0024B23BAB|nr:AMP-binding protein [Bradyrhizobium sp. CB2312]WFU71255.1 AMP-binding protein [Bradyrhizobium sp. CB2312]